MRLIIVDDNTDFRNDLKTFLEVKLGHTVIADVASGEEFLKLKNLASADIILMDIRMDGIDGFKTTELVLRDFFYLKIVALSLDTGKIFLQNLIETGFKGFVDKNEIFNNLETTLQRIIRGKYTFSNNIQLRNSQLQS